MMRERGHLKSLLLFLFLINITPPCFAAALKGPRPGAWIEILSWWPRAVLYHGFLSDEEADHVRKIAEPRLGRSGVLNYDGSRTPEDSIRTSYGTFLAPAEDDVIKAIDIRVATWTHLPPSHSESVQVLRYEFNQTYGAHWDEVDPSADAKMIGGASPRVATVLMYLADTEHGGETAFPHSFWIDEELQTYNTSFSECASSGVAVKPKKGDALLVWNLKVDVKKLDPWSMHAGCPVLSGVKWTAVKWLHTEPVVNPNLYDDDQDDDSGGVNGSLKRLGGLQRIEKNTGGSTCLDSSEACKVWASRGECVKNPEYMLGGIASMGMCREACGACCPPQDVLCDRKVEGMRRRLGLGSS